MSPLVELMAATAGFELLYVIAPELADVGIVEYSQESLERITKEVKKKNLEGYSFEGADASFYILSLLE